MPNLAAIVRKIKSIEATAKVTDTLKIVSANKFVVYKDLNKKAGKYINGIYKLFYQFYTSSEHIYLESNKKLVSDVKSGILWVVIGTDIGMCGDFNQKVASYVKENVFSKDKVVCLGTKLLNLIKNIQDINILASFSSEVNNSKIDKDVTDIAETIMRSFIKNKCNGLKIIYLKDKQNSIIEQVNVLPFTKNYFKDLKTIKIKKATFTANYPDIIVELFPEYFNCLLFGSMIQSKISEHTLRRDLMHSATKNANELLEEYTLNYNKLRQSIITQEISEIVAAVQTKK